MVFIKIKKTKIHIIAARGRQDNRKLKNSKNSGKFQIVINKGWTRQI